MESLFFLALALLQEEPPPAEQPAGGGFPLLPLVLIFAIFWFVLIVPERKQRKRRQAMIDALQKGDRVLTSGGIYGVVMQVQDEVITVQVAEGVRMRFAKPAITTVLGGEKEAEAKEGEKKS